MTQTTSHPNRWLYAGVLERVTWQAGDMQVRCWGGRQAQVGDGDRVLILRTPTHAEIVRVEGIEA